MNPIAQIRAAKQSASPRLNLKCGLTEFPTEIFELADTLEILDLSGNALSSLPADFARLHKLRILFCSDNLFTELPAVLGQCPQLSMVGFKSNQIRSIPAAALGKSLRWLTLTDNKIEALPATIGQCTQLQKLMLSGNRLTSLPAEMSACHNLQLIRIAANQFTALPDWLPGLPRLSWLAFAGNPCAELHETEAVQRNPISSISWPQLELQHKLGEGASGVIHQAQWQHKADSPLAVAVKLFKGAMTSDGLPHSEKTACISAGNHPNLIAVHGKIAQHPAQATGLVMALIDPSFRNLAGPPSLDSCTRDIYAADSRFSLPNLLHMATDIASAARQLHAKGIMHGDLYAHNILHNGQGDCLLGDFGAASFYDLHNNTLALALQRIEVRAFGCLLEELLERCDADNKTTAKLQALQASCMQENTTARPLFSEIVNFLEDLQRAS